MPTGEVLHILVPFMEVDDTVERPTRKMCHQLSKDILPLIHGFSHESPNSIQIVTANESSLAHGPSTVKVIQMYFYCPLVKSVNYFKKKKLAEFEYEYNEQGYLALRIQTFSINHKHRVDSVTYEYEFDSDGRLVREIKCSRGLHAIVSEYSDFDERDNTQTESRSFNDRAQFEWRKRYDEQDRLTWIAKFQSDSIESENKIEYNDFSDVSASTITYYPEDEEVTYMGDS
jgi:hypothetical protein